MFPIIQFSRTLRLHIAQEKIRTRIHMRHCRFMCTQTPMNRSCANFHVIQPSNKTHTFAIEDGIEFCMNRSKHFADDTSIQKLETFSLKEYFKMNYWKRRICSKEPSILPYSTIPSICWKWTTHSDVYWFQYCVLLLKILFLFSSFISYSCKNKLHISCILFFWWNCSYVR